MAHFHPTNLNKSTPKRHKMIGNILLIAGGGISASVMTLPDHMVHMDTKTWIIFVITQVTTLGKILTSMYSEETNNPENESAEV